MNAEERERQLQQWLDDALAQYSEVEPRAGLEQRILAHLEQRQQARRSWWQWAWIPVAVAVLVSIGVLWMSRDKPEPQPAPVAKVERSGAQPARLTPPPVAKLVPPKRAARRVMASSAPPPKPSEDLPRLAVFPSPTTASPQELGGMRLAAKEPSVAL